MEDKNYVLKFGGTSLKNAESIKKAGEIIKKFYDDKKPDKLIVVVSAQGKISDDVSGAKVTDLLEKIYGKEDVEKNKEEIIRRTRETCSILEIEEPNDIIEEFKNIQDGTYSEIVSFGERISSEVVGRYLANFLPVKIKSIFDSGMLTEGLDDKDVKLSEDSKNLIAEKLREDSRVIIFPGFLGYNSERKITTLGRDGSNYTATSIGSAIKASGVYIFSDEPGVKRASPNYIPDAEIIPEITYAEAIEFAELGAKIINAKSVIPARNNKIPMYFVDEKFNGTCIKDETKEDFQGVKIIASSSGHHLLNLDYDEDKPGVLSDVAKMFRDSGINIESICDERHSLSIAYIPPSEGKNDLLKEKLSKNYKHFFEDTFSRISIIGEGMRGQIGLLKRVTSCFAKENISIEAVSQGLNQLNITIFIPQKNEKKAVESLYGEIFK